MLDIYAKGVDCCKSINKQLLTPLAKTEPNRTDIMRGIMGVKQLNKHFNWINVVGLLSFGLINFSLIYFLEMKTFGFYYSIAFKYILQNILMLIIIFKEGNLVKNRLILQFVLGEKVDLRCFMG